MRYLFGSSLILLAVALAVGSSARAQTDFRSKMRERLQQKRDFPSLKVERADIAGLEVAIWRPEHNSSPAPLVVFSHGFHGINTQSAYLMKAMADAGYFVVAPNHADASKSGLLGSGLSQPELSFAKPRDWSDSTYKQRGEDICKLIDALQKDPKWSAQIDFSKMALAGHSLGGYTILGLAGARPSWSHPDIKAVLALSPYCEPYVFQDTIKNIRVPVMYQGGTLDFGITPSVKRSGGAYDKTSAPAYFVEFDKFGHLGWTGFERDSNKRSLVDFYSIAFLDKYVKGSSSADCTQKRSGIVQLESK